MQERSSQNLFSRNFKDKRIPEKKKELPPWIHMEGENLQLSRMAILTFGAEMIYFLKYQSSYPEYISYVFPWQYLATHVSTRNKVWNNTQPAPDNPHVPYQASAKQCRTSLFYIKA